MDHPIRTSTLKPHTQLVTHRITTEPVACMMAALAIQNDPELVKVSICFEVKFWANNEKRAGASKFDAKSTLPTKRDLVRDARKQIANV